MRDRSRQPDIFREFVESNEPKLRRALIARYGPERGREATAEALGYAWKHWSRVGVMENPVGYLFRVGQSRSRSRHLLPMPVLFPVHGPDGEPWSEPKLPEAIAQLSDRQRTAVLLIHGYGWTYQEVANLSGMSRSSVQKHAERGMTKLRAVLEAQIA